MNAFAGIRPKGGQNPTPLAFFPGVCSGGYLFSSGVQPPQPPANFYPATFVAIVDTLLLPMLSRIMRKKAVLLSSNSLRSWSQVGRLLVTTT